MDGKLSDLKINFARLQILQFSDLSELDSTLLQQMKTCFAITKKLQIRNSLS